MKHQGALGNSFISAFIGGVIVFVALLVILPRMPQITAPIIIGALKDDPQTLAQILEMARSAQQQLDDKQLLDGVTLSPELLLDTTHAIVKSGADFSAEQAIYIVEYGDYFCSVCKIAHGEVATLLQRQTDLQWIYHHLPIMNPLSPQAALKVMSAGDKASELHDRLFATTGKHNQESLDKMTQGLDLPIAQPETMMQLQQAVQYNVELAEKLGVIGTPAFVLMAKDGTGKWVIDAMAGWPPLSQVQERLSALRNQL